MRLQAFQYLGRALAFFLLTAAPAAAQLRVITYVSGLSRPVGFVQDPSDPAVQYVLEQGGVIKVVNNGVLQPTPFLQISSLIAPNGEQGLLGLAFPPNYGASGRFYVLYTRAGDGNIVVARYNRSANQLVANANSRVAMRWSTGDDFIVHNKFSNHNAGCLQFGPDGMLYIASGDGGSGGDPDNNAQNPSSLLGKILRIDVSSAAALASTNGFVVPPGNAGLTRPEIWSLGWRNPWRFSFDYPAFGGTGAMVIADVGQGNWEEIDYEPANRPGRNYGWRLWEGTHVYNQPPGTPSLTQPIFDYSHSMGASVTGGYVYRGSAVEMRGRYFFADYVFRRVWSLALSIDGSGEARASDLRDHTSELSAAGALGGISSFGIDADGDLYIVDHTRGLVLKTGREPRPPTNVRIIRE